MAQEFSEREAHIKNAWKRYAAQIEAGNQTDAVKIDEVSFENTAEAIDRKARSNAILEAQGIPVLQTLPVIETESQSIRRTDREVAERALALIILAVKGETQDHDLGKSLTKEFKVKSYFSPNERDYMNAENPEMTQHVQASWRYEALNVLVWALGYSEELSPANDICDVPFLAKTISDLGHDKFIAHARLRPQSEILDAADLIYRQHWATVQAQRTGQDLSEKLDPGVVLERHYALNWLIGYLDQEWDDVSTDT